MEINYIRTSGWQAAFRGMRNPKNSWNKSDSIYGLIHSESKKDIIKKVIPSWVKSMNTDYHYAETVLNNNGVLQEMNDISEVFFIGGADMKLAKSLIKAGSEHRKMLRQIFITFDITAPLYFFKEFDTYKINTTSNSTSTMHTIEKKEITLSSFEVGDYNPDLPYITGEVEIPISSFIDDLIEFLEMLRKKYIETGDKRYWKELIRWTPASWLQTRTYSMDYENALNMLRQRKTHKLTEWQDIFCKNLEDKLPYMNEFLSN